MQISKMFLNRFVDIKNITDEDLENNLSCRGGLEVEVMVNFVPQVPYTIGKILTVEKHPHADKLNICLVQTEKQTLQIVCGAPNVKENAYVIVAHIGIIMPNGMKIEPREVKGVRSEGMLCSLQEIGIEEKFVPDVFKKGIYLFDEANDTHIGKKALDVLGFSDTLIDLSITPNRSDCLSYHGIAHEVSALFHREVDIKKFDAPRKKGTFKLSDFVNHLEIDDGTVKSYLLAGFKNLKVRTSPQWLQTVLIASGIRPINNIVDITNYIMLLFGTPIHAFDANKLNKKSMHVRFALPGETIVTLDNQERKLNGDDILIASSGVPVALAGIMGGANTEISSETENLIVELAVFPEKNIRNTSQRLNLRTDASQRFEKGVDARLLEKALNMLQNLLATYADAEVSEDIYEKHFETVINPIITFSHKELEQKIGTILSRQEVTKILESLSFFVVQQSDEKYAVQAPTWRLDIKIFEDVVEEIVRLYGYDKLPNAMPIDVCTPVVLSKKQKQLEKIHGQLQAQGLQEILTYTLKSSDEAERGSYQNKLLPFTILHPLNKERETLKTTNYSSMIETLMYHKNRAFLGGAFYEITDLYGKDMNKQILSIGAYGILFQQSLYQTKMDVDVFVMKGWIEYILSNVSSHKLEYIPSKNDLLHPGKSADIYIEDQYLGSFGNIHPLAARKLGVSDDLYLAELEMDVLLSYVSLVDNLMVHEISKFPNVERDLSFIINKKHKLATLVNVIWQAADIYCQNVEIIDIYDLGNEEETHSVTIRLSFNNSKETLASQTVDMAIEKILGNVKNELGGYLRE